MNDRWKYIVIWEWLPQLQRWGVRLAHMQESFAWALECNPTPTITEFDPLFWQVPTYKIYEEYIWNGKKWSSCGDSFIVPTRNW